MLLDIHLRTVPFSRTHDKSWRPSSPTPSRIPQGGIKKPRPGCSPIYRRTPSPAGWGHSGIVSQPQILRSTSFCVCGFFKITDMKNRPQTLSDKLCNFSTQIKAWKLLEAINGNMEQGWQDAMSHLNFLLITGTLQKLHVSQIFAGGFPSEFILHPIAMVCPFFSFLPLHHIRLNPCWSTNNVIVLCWALGF